MIDLIRRVFIPGSFLFLLGGLSLGVAMLWMTERSARWGRRWLLALTLFYLLFSTPFAAERLVRMFSDEALRLNTAADAQGATAIVLLGGGSVSYGRSTADPLVHDLGALSGLRVVEAARLYRLLNGPLVIASGGIVVPGEQLAPEAEVMKRALVALGVPADRIVLETASRNTRSQAIEVKPILQRHRIDRFVLVTSPPHMYRSMGAFRAEFLDPIPSVAACCSWHRAVVTASGWQPSLNALNVSTSVFYEFMAVPYYWARGWLTRPAIDLQGIRKGI
jgi:uncharacterized SAM-binding protein YcdF (DUF218 family)